MWMISGKTDSGTADVVAKNAAAAASFAPEALPTYDAVCQYTGQR